MNEKAVPETAEATRTATTSPAPGSAPVIAISRHRMQTDGKGVTTLVGFYGCPLRCRFCLNPQSFAPGTKVTHYTPKELYERVKIDQLYFLATGGGVTFGGGEPLLYPDFLRAFRSLCGQNWHLCTETSLHVPWESVELAASCIDHFYIDCKDTSPGIYSRYTGKSNADMLKNLARLASLISSDRITVRIPLIPGYNTDSDRKSSKAFCESLGITNFDLFTYRTNASEEKRKQIPTAPV